MTEGPAQSEFCSSSPDLRLIGVTFAHCALVARLHGLCFEEGWNSGTVAQVLRLAGAFGLIATVPERTRSPLPSGDPVPAGFALVAGTLDERELLSLGVAPAFRKRGIAAALIRGVVDRVRAEGVGKLFLEVAEDNAEARQLYESFGFRQIGRRPNYYRRQNGPAVAAMTLAMNVAAMSL
jgi:ribosomal-protein-alanine N-acetyltransferase